MPERKSEGNSSALPNRRLNPLFNPLLASHMGRWAQVYYTASPENRDRIVEELVSQLEREQELERELQSGAEAEAAPADSPGDRAASEPLETIAHLPDRSGRDPIYSDAAYVAAPGAEPELAPRSAPDRPAAAEPIRGAPRPHYPDPIDIREALGTSYANSEAAPAGRRIAIAIVVLAALLGGVWYLQNRSAGSPAATKKVAAPANVPSEPAAVLPEQKPPETGSKPSEATASPAQADVRPAERPQVTTPERRVDNARETLAADKAATSAPPPGVASPSGNGESERLLAERYLQGRGVERDSSIAARLLWNAVRKQNAAALVQLAGLYARGDGVPKDCAQAKVLAEVAERHGAEHSETARAALRQSSCE